MSENGEHSILLAKWISGELSQKEIEQIDNETKTRIQKAIDEIDTWTLPEANPYHELISKVPKKTAKIIKLNTKRMFLAIAASIVLLIGTFFLFNNKQLETFATTTQPLEFTLPDGSFVALNKNSTISYSLKDWEEGKRKLTLNGEAYFRVKKGNTFSVKGILGLVEVLGTEFNVLARSKAESVACYEGKVSVSTDINKNILTSGMGTSIDVEGHMLTHKVNILSEARWNNEFINFSQTKLSEVLTVIESNFDINIISNNVNLNRTFTGRISQSNIESALTSALLPMGISYELNEKELILNQ